MASNIPFLNGDEEDDDDSSSESSGEEQGSKTGDQEQSHNAGHSSSAVDELEDRITALESNMEGVQDKADRLGSEDEVLGDRIERLEDQQDDVNANMQELLGLYDAFAARINPLFGDELQSLIPELSEEMVQESKPYNLKHEEVPSGDAQQPAPATEDDSSDIGDQFEFESDVEENGHESHDEHEHGHESHDEHEHGHESHDEHEHGHESHDEHEHSHESHDEHEHGHESHDEHEHQHGPQNADSSPPQPSGSSTQETHGDFAVSYIAGDLDKEVIAMRWLDSLVSISGYSGSIRALNYYQDIGWISPEAYHQLVNRLRIQEGSHDGEVTVSGESSPISKKTHKTSSYFVKQLTE